MDNVSTIRELNEEHPEFNLELTTKEIEDVVVYNVNDETKLTILEDMANKGIIGNQNNYEVLYCSYGDDYLDLLLDNDIEYVYYIYGTHLHTVYTKEEAIRMWPNLSEIITLQDRPIVVE
jgi:ribonucleotide reductase alpha subunit